MRGPAVARAGWTGGNHGPFGIKENGRPAGSVSADLVRPVGMLAKRAGHLGTEQGTHPHVHPGAAVDEPLAEGGFHAEAGFLGRPREWSAAP